MTFCQGSSSQKIYIEKFNSETQRKKLKHETIIENLHECACLIEFIICVGESDKMRGLLSILSLFCNEFKSLKQEHEY